jgi:uncharacterized membrane protein
MNIYLLLKTLHIVSSVLLVGTGFGSAFYLYFCNRSKNVATIAVVTRLVVRADWCFTTPAVIIQPISGIALAHLAGWALDTPWILLSLGLYFLAGICWLPVVWLQIKMQKLAQSAHEQQEAIAPLYWQYARYWEALGYPAFLAMLGVFYLMVNKPGLWM